MPARKGKPVIDHICSNIPDKLIHTDVILTDETSDFETLYVIINIKRYQNKPATNTHTHDKRLT